MTLSALTTLKEKYSCEEKSILFLRGRSGDGVGLRTRVDPYPLKPLRLLSAGTRSGTEGYVSHGR